MVKKTVPVVAPLLLLIVMLLPLLLIDTLVIYFLGGTYSSLLSLVLFLLVFYLVNGVVGLFVDGFLQVVGERTTLRVNDLVSLCADVVSSLVVLQMLHSLFDGIHLPTSIQLVIVLVHTLIFYLVSHSKGDGDASLGEEKTGLVDKAIEFEIEQLLIEEDVVTCIKTMRDRHPELPFNDLVKTVRQVNREKSK